MQQSGFACAYQQRVRMSAVRITFKQVHAMMLALRAHVDADTTVEVLFESRPDASVPLGGFSMTIKHGGEFKASIEDNAPTACTYASELSYFNIDWGSWSLECEDEDPEDWLPCLKEIYDLTVARETCWHVQANIMSSASKKYSWRSAEIDLLDVGDDPTIPIDALQAAMDMPASDSQMYFAQL